jgi:NAD(P)-dependent dehydrogenase (short-subunit alcohol dehydrogenase family)
VPSALVIGSSDGIGLALVRALLGRGFRVAGLSRSPLPPERLGLGPEVGCEPGAGYRHVVADVRDAGYRDRLSEICSELGSVDVCVYCAGIGEPLNLDLERLEESAVFEVNLLGLVRTIEVVLPGMLAVASGHVIGLSSLADAFPDPGAPSYGASKAGMSAYLDRLGLAVRSRGVFVTSVRFGFVDTKMARADVRPLMITPEAAADHVLRCMARRPRRYSYPRTMAALLWLIAWPNRLRLRFG